MNPPFFTNLLSHIVEAKNTIKHTLITNARDFLVGIFVVTVVAFVADLVSKLATFNVGLMWLVGISDQLKSFSILAGANLAGWIMFAFAWPSLNKFSNYKFETTWNSLSGKEKLDRFLALAAVEIVAAAIIFAR